MTKRYTNNKINNAVNSNSNANNSSNVNSNGDADNELDWSQIIAQAMFEGGQSFLKCITSATPNADETQLQADEKQADQRFARAIDYARRDRANLGTHILSAVRNWSRKQAIAILREKVAGKPLSQDFYQTFHYDLHEEIASLISDIQLFWKQKDEQLRVFEEQRAAAKREEGEQAFGNAHKYVIGMHDAVLDGERQRQSIFNDGIQAVEKWSTKYENSVRTREQELEERVKLIQQQERENREQQLALRSLARWDDRRSFADTVVSTGKNTIGCFLIWLLLIAGILLAIYFAFPAHH